MSHSSGGPNGGRGGLPEMDRPAEEALKLWEIADELVKVIGMIEEAEGELTPEAEAELINWDATFDKKVERVVHVIENFELTSEAAAKAERRMKRWRISKKKVADGLRAYLANQMKRSARDRVDLPTGCVTLTKSKRPAIRWVGGERLAGDAPVEDSIPEAYARTKRELDGNLAYLAFKAGQIKDGDGWHIKFKESVTIR